MARKNADEGELIHDLGARTTVQAYTPYGKSKQGRRKSYPGESVYKKRYKWWVDQGFGSDAAKWAAAWRFGEPKKTLGVKTDEERKAIGRALQAANNRKEEVDRLLRSEQERGGRTREEIIKHLDAKLRTKDKIKKLADKIKGVEYDTSIYDKSIEPNIFLEVSPD